jgi:hypothetical protein
MKLLTVITFIFVSVRSGKIIPEMTPILVQPATTYVTDAMWTFAFKTETGIPEWGIIKITPPEDL